MNRESFWGEERLGAIRSRDAFSLPAASKDSPSCRYRQINIGNYYVLSRVHLSIKAALVAQGGIPRE
jgi:hypothetical protein